MVFDIKKMNALKEEYLWMCSKIAEWKSIASLIHLDVLMLTVNIEEFPEARGELENVKVLVQSLVNESERKVLHLDDLAFNEDSHKQSDHEAEEDGSKQSESIHHHSSSEMLLTSGISEKSMDENISDKINLETNDTEQAETSKEPISGKSESLVSEKSDKKCFVCDAQDMGSHDYLLHCRVHDNEFSRKTGTPMCVVCGEKFKTLKSLRTHRQLHEETKEFFICVLCGTDYPSSRQFKRHMKIHSSKGSENTLPNETKETVPNSKLASIGIDLSRVTKVTLDAINFKPVHKCHLCDKEFKNRLSLSIHNRIHDEKRKNKKDDVHICPVCGKQCKSKISMSLHKRSHDKVPVIHKCDKCDRQFQHKWQYTKHLYLHKSERSFICDTCGKTFKTASNLKGHIALTHAKKYQQVCKLCGKTFSRMSNLTKHLRSHNGEKPYKCSICGKAFVNIANCKSHERRHYGNHAHYCPNCGKGFDFLRQLRFHQKRVHAEGMPSSCSVCGKSFATMAEAQMDKTCLDFSGMHQLVCGEAKRYKCSLCTAGFGHKGLFASHLLSAHIRDLDRCLVCDNDIPFASSQDLELHLKSVHLKSKGRPAENPPPPPAHHRPTEPEHNIYMSMPMGGFYY